MAQLIVGLFALSLWLTMGFIVSIGVWCFSPVAGAVVAIGFVATGIALVAGNDGAKK